MEVLIFMATVLIVIFMSFSFVILKTYVAKSINGPNFPPVKGTVFTLLFNYNRIHDHHAELARKHKTFRFLAPGQSLVYTTDVRNIEHVLKTNFGKYTKGRRNQCIFADLLGEGIFAVDGDEWRQQRKVASFEFSRRVLRDFSCSVFRRGAAKLARVVSQFAGGGQVFDMQVGKS